MPLKMWCRCGAVVVNAYEWKAQTLKMYACEIGAAWAKGKPLHTYEDTNKESAGVDFCNH